MPHLLPAKRRFIIIYIDFMGIKRHIEKEGIDREDVLKQIPDCKEVRWFLPAMEGELNEITPLKHS